MRKITRILLSFHLLFGLMLSSWSAVFAQDSTPQIHITQVDNSKFPNVTIYISVTNAAGDPIGVDPNTIQISENGQLMQPTSISGGGQAGAGALTTMLVIDISGSMAKGNKIDAAKDAAKAYVNQMRPGDQAGLITFDSHVYNVQALTSDTAALTSAIDGLKPGSDTAMYDGLKEAAKSMEGVSGRKAIILLSDGLDNQSSSTAEDVVSTIGPSGLTISSIGFGDVGTGKAGQAGIDEAGLKSLAEHTGGQYAYASDAQAVSGLFQGYGELLQSEYAITYVSPSALRDGVNRNLSVTLTGAPASAEGKYNPGGVLPEVTASQSWPLFAAILVGLLVLLILPVLIGRGLSAAGGGGARGKKGRVKLGQAPGASAKGRVKMR